MSDNILIGSGDKDVDIFGGAGGHYSAYHNHYGKLDNYLQLFEGLTCGE